MAQDAVTWLFVPATRTDRLAKAFDAGADAVIADLEDAVDAQDKSGARERLDAVLAGGVPAGRVWLRTNAVDTPWFAADRALVQKHRRVLAGQDAAHAARLGFGAKLCIHPSQLEVVAQAFAPTQAQLQWATRIVALAQQSGAGAQRLDGRMVDRPVIERARTLLARQARRPAA